MVDSPDPHPLPLAGALHRRHLIVAGAAAGAGFASGVMGQAGAETVTQECGAMDGAIGAAARAVQEVLEEIRPLAGREYAA